MTARANAEMGEEIFSSQSPLPNDEIQALKRSLQEQRRMVTLLQVDIQRETEAREALQAQLMEANAELAASRDRRKEMARVISNREAKINGLNEQLQARYHELAALQRYLMRWTVAGWVKGTFLGVRRLIRGKRSAAAK